MQPPKDSPPKKKAHKPKKKATPPKASKPNKAAPLKVMPTPTAPVQSDLFIAEKADGRRLVPSGDYQGEWVSADLRFLVEEMAVRHRNGQIGTRFIVTDLAIQRGTKKVVHTVGSFEDAEAWVRSL